MIGMYTPECGYYDSGFTYQLTLNSKSVKTRGLSKEGKQEIIDVILNGPSVIKDKNSSTDVEQEKNEVLQTLSIFPNPVVDIIQVELSNDKIRSIQITDLSGKSLESIKFNGENNVEEVTVYKLPSGMYFVETQGVL